MSAIWLKHSSADAALVRQIRIWRSPATGGTGVVGSTARKLSGLKFLLGDIRAIGTSAGIYGKHRPMAQRPRYLRISVRRFYVESAADQSIRIRTDNK